MIYGQIRSEISFVLEENQSTKRDYKCEAWLIFKLSLLLQSIEIAKSILSEFALEKLCPLLS